MFPARPIVELDHTPAMERFKGCPEDRRLDYLAGIRTCGYLRQAECITSYAMEVFVDIANSANTVFSRIKTLQARIKDIEQQVPSAIERMRSVAKANWPTASPEYVPTSNDLDDEAMKEFKFEETTFAKKMIGHANPAPDFSSFASITKGYDPSDPEKEVNFAINFTNPDFVRVQYKQELIENILAEQERQRAEAKARKEKQRAENENLVSRKSKQPEGQQNQDAEDLISALASPPQRPLGLCLPPPKGQAKHGAVPISLANGGVTKVQSSTPNVTAYSAPKPSSQPASKNIPPPPPPPASLPPPPPGGAPKPPKSAMSTADLLKEGVKLKKVEEKKEAPAAPLTHLDLIKRGGFKLKKVDNSKPLPPPVKKVEETDPNSLSLAEILARAASIRDAVAASDSDEEGEDESETSSESW